MNKLINEDNGFEEPKSDKSKIKKVDNSEKGLRMWADPILSAQRGVFGVPMTLEGFHLKKDNNEANDQLQNRFMALTFLISSQIIMLTQDEVNQGVTPETFNDLEFI